jgi:hypothetical protein
VTTRLECGRGAVGLVIESRLAVRALTKETDEALALIKPAAL